MTPTQIIQLVLQILALAPTLVQAAQSVKELGVLISSGTVTANDIAALLERTKANSAVIQGLAEKDRAPDNSSS